MAAVVQVTGSAISAKALPSLEGLRSSTVRFNSVGSSSIPLSKRTFKRLVVKAATVVAPAYTSVKPLGDRVLVKIKSVEEVSTGGILLPTTAQPKPYEGVVVAVGDGKDLGKIKVDVSVKTGSQVVFSKYAGTEIEFDGSKHLLLKEDDVVGILDTNDIKDLKPLSDRVLIKVIEAEEMTRGGLYLTEASKEKPSIGTVVAVGPGPLGEEGTRKPLSISTGNSVMYAKFAGSDFQGADGSKYIVLRESDVMAVLS